MSRERDCVEIPNCEVGIDSDSGLAVCVKIEDSWHWIPYSQIEEVHRDPRVQGNDRIVVTRWIAQKKGIISD